MWWLHFCHQPNKNLSSTKTDVRVKNFQHSLWVAKLQVCGLKAKVGHLIEKEGVSLQHDDVTDSSDICTELSTSIDKSYLAEFPQQIWGEEKKYNSLKDKRQTHPPAYKCFFPQTISRSLFAAKRTNPLLIHLCLRCSLTSKLCGCKVWGWRSKYMDIVTLVHSICGNMSLFPSKFLVCRGVSYPPTGIYYLCTASNTTSDVSNFVLDLLMVNTRRLCQHRRTWSIACCHVRTWVLKAGFSIVLYCLANTLSNSSVLSRCMHTLC